MRSSQWKQLPFEQACREWLATRKDISDKMRHEYELNIRTLTKFFGHYTLEEAANSDYIAEYQTKRNEEDGVGASGVNHETSVLQQVMKQARLWDEVKPDFRPIKRKRWQPGRVITETQKDRLFRTAAVNPRWLASLLFAQISINTSGGPKELSCVRLRDIDRKARVVQISAEGAKNNDRIRPLPCNEEAWAAVERALERARGLGSVSPEHYLFPFRDKRTKSYDPARHQREFKWSWDKMTKAAGLPGLQMYDLRRTFVTEMLKDPMVSDETVIKMAGHVGKEMLRHYSYRRLDAMRKAVKRLDRKKRRPKAVKKPVAIVRTFPVAIPESSDAAKREAFLVLAKALGITG